MQPPLLLHSFSCHVLSFCNTSSAVSRLPYLHTQSPPACSHSAFLSDLSIYAPLLPCRSLWRPQMAVPRFCNGKPVDVIAARIFPRHQTQICGIDVPLCKPLEISGFHQTAQRRMGFYSEKAYQLFYLLHILRFACQLLYPLIKRFYTVCLIFVCDQIFVQRFPVQIAKFQ